MISKDDCYRMNKDTPHSSIARVLLTQMCGQISHYYFHNIYSIIK